MPCLIPDGKNMHQVPFVQHKEMFELKFYGYHIRCIALNIEAVSFRQWLFKFIYGNGLGSFGVYFVFQSQNNEDGYMLCLKHSKLQTY
jgi:hypothetical protein